MGCKQSRQEICKHDDFDVYDGARPPEYQSSDQMQSSRRDRRLRLLNERMHHRIFILIDAYWVAVMSNNHVLAHNIGSALTPFLKRTDAIQTIQPREAMVLLETALAFGMDNHIVVKTELGLEVRPLA